MKKATIYARYSSEQQAETSIDDQVRLCRQKMMQLGLTESTVHFDKAISGSTPVSLRNGGAALLKDLERGAFDVLIIEGLDRLSRDLFEQEKILRRMEFLGIRIIGVSDGYDSEMTGNKLLRSVRGAINEHFLDDLGKKTHRGLSGKVIRGFIAAGKSYGYDIEKIDGGSIYQINPQQAEWVKYIFNAYADGTSVRKIAHYLNKQHIPSPRNGTWAVSAIYGSPVKGSGILNNQLYIGNLVWNRSKWRKDPETGKRHRLERPKSEWIITEIPELRIIEQSLWDAVRTRIDTGRDENGHKRYGKQCKTLLGGLLRCPHCKGAVIAVNSNKYGCINAKDRGPTVCQGFYIERDLVDNRIISIIKDELLSPEAASKFEIHFKNALDRLTQNQTSDLNKINIRIKEINRQVNQLVDALVNIGNSESITNRLKALETEKKQLEQEQAIQHNLSFDVPDVATIYERLLEDLAEKIKSRTDKLRPAFEEYLGAIPLTIENNSVYAHVRTSFNKLLTRQQYLKVVARARIHLQIFSRIEEGYTRKIWVTNLPNRPKKPKQV